MTLTLKPPSPTVLRVGSIELHVEEQRLVGPRGELRLTASHFRVLHRIMMRPGVIIGVSDLISEMYPDPDLEGDNGHGCLRQVLLTLRRAIVLLGSEKSAVIANERNIGYFISGRIEQEKAA